MTDNIDNVAKRALILMSIISDMTMEETNLLMISAGFSPYVEKASLGKDRYAVGSKYLSENLRIKKIVFNIKNKE